jgi:hypothetical protein
MKTKILIIVCVICVALMGTISLLYSNLEKTKKDRDRLESNLLNSKFELDSVKGKNGEYHIAVEGLTVKKNELEQFNSELTKKVENMGLKIKNLQTIVDMKAQIIYKDSLIPTKKINDTTFVSKIDNKWIQATWNSTLIKNGEQLKVTDFESSTDIPYTIAHETVYKRVWLFWKKPKGIRLHVKSDNPYVVLTGIEYFELIK